MKRADFFRTSSQLACASSAAIVFCPAARNRPARPNDLHCECTRATDEAIFETALGRHVRVGLVETVRRGDQRYHLVAHLS